MSQHLSPNQRAFRRLLKNRPAVAGAFVIMFAVFIALFAPLLAPDHTPNADEQIAEINTAPPGFEATFLRLPKDHAPPQSSLFMSIWRGRENPYKLQPITAYRIENDHLIIQKYTGHTTPPQPDTLLLSKVTGVQTAGMGKQISLIEKKHITKRRFLLGTDKQGRDNLSRLLLGVRISLSVGIMAVLISLSIGIVLGAAAGYFGGHIDRILMTIVSLFWAIPLLLLVFALVLVMGQRFEQIYLAIGLTMWVEVARLVRGQVMSLRGREFIEAAQSLGLGHARIIRVHILPNIMGPVMVIAASDFASAIIIEAGLSFLGIGVQPPTPSWGTMLNEYYGYIGTSKAFLAIIPGIAICILVLAFNLLGNGLRDALDVKLR